MGLRKHFVAKWDFRSRVPFSQPISQLRNGVGRLRNGTRVPKGCFTTAKHPAKWGFGCENWNFNALEISQLRNEGMRLRNGTHVPRGGFAEGGIGLRNHFVAKWRFRSDFLGLQNNFAAKWRFHRGLFCFATKGHFYRGLLWL